MIEKVVNIAVKENGLNEATQAADKLGDKLREVESATGSMATGMKDSSNSVLENGGAMGLLNDATGGLAMTVKDAVEASVLFTKSQKAAAFFQGIYTTVVGTSTGAMKLFRLALVSTGIGAIVVGIGLLIANFDKVKDAVMKFIPGLAEVAKLFEGLVNWVTDFIGVTSDATRALDAMVAASEKSLKRSQDFLDTQGDKYDEFTRRKIQANIDYNKKVIELNADETRSEEEKLSLLKAFRDKADREIIKADKDRNDKLEKERKAASDKADAEAKSRADKAKAEADRRKVLDDKLKEERRKLAEENLKAENEFQIAINEAQFAQRFLDIENKQRQLDEIAKMEEEAMAESQRRKEEQDAKDLKAKEDKLTTEKNIMDAIVSIKTSGTDMLDSLETLGLKRSKATETARKALALTQIAADTAQAISKAVPMAIDAGKSAAAAAGPAGPVVGPIVMASSLLGSLSLVAKNVATAKKLLGSGGGSGVPTATGSAAGVAAPQFNIVGQSGTNQLAQSIGARQGQPIEAFVVSGNVTSAQAMDRHRQQTATFGG